MMRTRYEPYIDGDYRSTEGELFNSYNPATGELLAEVRRGTPDDIDRAVQSAERARRGWARTKPSERGRIMLKIAAALRANADELAQMETLDNGQPLGQAKGDVETAARYFEYYGGAADKLHGDTIPLGPDYLSYTTHEPYGIVGFILPWNAPLNQAARGLGPALAAGNVAVIKPARETPITTLELARIATECGLPDGVLNVVPGFGTDAGTALTRHPLVRKVGFTGSVATGMQIAGMAAERLIPATLELGGKSPNIIFPDADLDKAVASSFFAFTIKSGQVCSAGTRALIHEDIYDEVVERLVERTRNSSLAPGIENPDVAALTTRAQLEKVSAYLELGKLEGARVAVGGGRPEGLENGFFVQPTIFADVDNSMRIAQEEIFGPVLCAIRFRDEDEAVRIANDTEFGLSAGVWSQDISTAHRVAGQIESGQVYINEYFAGGVETPFGGFKSSGIGREKGFEALRSYSQLRTVTIRL